MKLLVEVAKCQPHAVYAAYVHAEQHKYTYLLRTVADISELLMPLDDIILNEFIPALFGSSISPNERELLALPVKEGGLGLRIWSKIADTSYNVSKSNQNIELPTESDVREAKEDYCTERRRKNN